MKQFVRFGLFLGVAASLMAQSGTLSLGEITLLMPANGTSPAGSSCVSGGAACYGVDVVLATTGATTAPNQLAGLQFDLNYDPASLNITIGSGASATAASAVVNTICLGQATTIPQCPTPAANNPWAAGATPIAPQDNGNPGGQRAVIIGCCGASQTTPTSNQIVDGVVALLTVQATASPTKFTLTLMPSPYMVGTTQGGNNVAATSIPLAIGAGSSDPGKTGTLDLSKVYQVGDVFPFTGNNIGQFGSAAIDINSAIQVLFAVDSVPGYSKPPACTDRLDAMDSYPQDTATARGGNQLIDINDAIVTLFKVDNVPTYNSHPVRTSLGENGTCPASTGEANVRTSSRRPISRPETGATLVLGSAAAANGQERVPVYIEAMRELPGMAFTFAFGDTQSHLQFEAAPGVAPTMMQDAGKGVLLGAWLAGLDVKGGQRVLLGYLTGPSGFSANVKVFGISATRLSDLQLVGVDVAGGLLVQQ